MQRLQGSGQGHPLSCLITPTVQFEELQAHDKQVKIKHFIL